MVNLKNAVSAIHIEKNRLLSAGSKSENKEYTNGNKIKTATILANTQYSTDIYLSSTILKHAKIYADDISTPARLNKYGNLLIIL
uniref:hypothetical protein n=1 Tax=Gammaproteobacteria TaxID=1236 RepID=UPI00155DB0B5|nr:MULTISPECIES: hypothetical protein [Gammaproteobacteria]